MGDSPEELLQTTLPMLAEGQLVFERFLLHRILGRGGMGVVWKAHDQLLDKTVALKFIIESQAQDPEAVANLKRETRRCQELRHPGIVAIYDLHQDEHRVAVSMEYVEGSTLAALKRERENGCFDPFEVMPWMEELSLALTYAHEEARIVHRDIKPSNLILTDAGHVKVMDFGISQQLSGTIGSAAALSNAVSPPYGSPQQLLGERPSVADDVYSLGATIYDLLTGRPPFYRGKIDLQVLEVVPPPMEQRRHELENHGAAIPQRWEQLVSESLSKIPESRPTSIAQFVADLHKGLTYDTVTLPVIRIERPRPPAPFTPPPTEIAGGTTAGAMHAKRNGARGGSTSPANSAATAGTAASRTEQPHSKPDVARTRWMPLPQAARTEPRRHWLSSAAFVIIMALLTAGALHYAREFSRKRAAAAAAPAPVTGAASSDARSQRVNPLDAPPRKSTRQPPR